MLFCYIINFYKNYVIIIIILFNLFFFMKITFIFSCFSMFRHVPECSGMFHVPGFIDARVTYGFQEVHRCLSGRR